MAGGKFAVVEFEGDCTSVVPFSWLFLDQGQIYCHWTNSLLRIKSAAIANPNWPISSVVRVVCRRDNYEEADAVCQRFDQSSMDEAPNLTDLPTKCDDRLLPVKRQRKRKNYDSVSESDESPKKKKKVGSKPRTFEKLPSAPTYSGNKTHASSSRCTKGSESDDDVEGSTESDLPLSTDGEEAEKLNYIYSRKQRATIKASPSRGQQISSKPADEGTAKITPKSFNPSDGPSKVPSCIRTLPIGASVSAGGTSSPSTESEMNAGASRQAARSDQELLLRLLQVMEETRSIVKRLQADVDKLKLTVTSTGTSREFDESVVDAFQQPLGSQEELEEFCEKIENDRCFRKAAVSYISTIGGRDIPEKTRLVMYKLMSNELMMEFNFLGRGTKQKRSLKDLTQLTSLIFDCVRKNWTGPVYSKDVFEAVAECLKHAKQRQQRKEAAAARQIMAPQP